MALFDDLVGALKKAIGERMGPALEKTAEVMAEFEAGVELAREHGRSLVEAARRAEVEVKKRTADKVAIEKKDSGVVDAEVVVEVEKK